MSILRSLSEFSGLSNLWAPGGRWFLFAKTMIAVRIIAAKSKPPTVAPIISGKFEGDSSSCCASAFGFPPTEMTWSAFCVDAIVCLLGIDGVDACEPETVTVLVLVDCIPG